MILDLFAGPGGWSEALRLLGLADLGIEWDAAACATRAAAGHATIRADVATYPTEPFAGKVDGLIASPPCPTFSAAGKGEGLTEIGHLHAFAEAVYRRGWFDPWTFHQWSDPRTPLVLEPLRWVEALRPEWVLLEQVPPVLPLWEQYANIWQEQGYSVWAGVLNAADFGVPQTRRRAFVLAHRSRPAHPPEPTHAEDPTPTLFGPELLRWVTMAEALGWGLTDRAAYTFCGGNDGGFDLVGGSGARRAVADARAEGAWMPREGGDPGTGQGRDWKPGGTRDDAQTFDATEQPAPTVDGKGRWHVDRQGPLLQPGGGYKDTHRRLYDADEEPAPTIAFGNDAANWRWRDRRNDQSGADEVDPDWPLDRPATTLAGRDLVADPGANANRFNGAAKSRNDGYRVEAHEAAVLQSFRAEYPWQGTRSKIFEQIGNAVPPRLAAHVLAAITGRTYTP